MNLFHQVVCGALFLNKKNSRMAAASHSQNPPNRVRPKVRPHLAFLLDFKYYYTSTSIRVRPKLRPHLALLALSDHAIPSQTGRHANQKMERVSEGRVRCMCCVCCVFTSKIQQSEEGTPIQTWSACEACVLKRSEEGTPIQKWIASK